MRPAVERMKRLARRLEPQALFSAPEMVSVVDEDGVGSTSVVVDVFIPAGADGMAFRDSFFGALADALHTRDLERLAVGVGRLGHIPPNQHPGQGFQVVATGPESAAVNAP